MGRQDLPIRVQQSKALSYILRHGAQKEGLAIRPDGFIKVEDLLKRPKLKGVDVATLRDIVASCEKQRFNLAEEQGTLYIRANQGHSLKVEKLQLDPITQASDIPVVIHGTFKRFWPSIQEKGLSIMTRTHIHCAAGLATDSQVISGMRKSCDVFIYIDAAAALADGIPFFRSANGVILTTGMDGVLPPKYFARVTDKQGASILPAEPKADPVNTS